MRLAIISPYPDKERKQLMKMSTVAQYTEDVLLYTLPCLEESTKVTILTEILENPGRYSEEMKGHAIDIIRCYRKGASALAKITWKICRGGFDIVHFQHETFQFGHILSLFAFPLSLGITRLTSKAIATLHHVIPQDQINKSFQEIHGTRIPLPLIRLGFRIVYKAIGCTASELIVHEEFFKKTLIVEYKVDPAKINVIFHGIRIHGMLEKKDPGILRKEFKVPEDTETIFGFFGYISQYKGIDRLIQEFQAHCERFPKSTLVIAGAPHPRIAKDPEYRKYVECLKSSAQKSENRIVWVGPIKMEQIPRFYALVDCMVLPYRLTNSSSSILSDAIGYGVPMLVSGGLKPTVTNPAMLFTLAKGALKQKLDAFINRDATEKNDVQTYMTRLRNERLLSEIGRMTAALYKGLQKDILVLGAYGQTNLGDEYLLNVTLDLLGRSRCIVASSDKAQTERSHGVAAVSPRSDPRAFFFAFLRSKHIIVGGGDQFKLLKASTGQNKYRLLYKMAALTIAAAIWKKKVLLLGIGIGSLPTLFSRRITAFCLRRANGITTRDEGSATIIRAMTGRADIRCGGDLSFLKPMHPSGSTGNDTCLAIAPAFELEHGDAYESVINALANCANSYLSANERHHAVLLPFQTSFHAHPDSKSCTELLDRIGQKNKCILETSLSKDTACEIYGRIDTLWGIRLHSLIFALMRGIPFIALVYDEKVRRFLSDAGCERWGIELDRSFTAEKLMALQAELQSEASLVRAHMEAQREKMIGKTSAHRDALHTFLSRSA